MQPLFIHQQLWNQELNQQFVCCTKIQHEEEVFENQEKTNAADLDHEFERIEEDELNKSGHKGRLVVSSVHLLNANYSKDFRKNNVWQTCPSILGYKNDYDAHCPMLGHSVAMWEVVNHFFP